MSANNNCSLLGNLGSDPEYTYTTNGVPIAKVSLAVRKYDSRSDNNEKTCWFKLKAFGKIAERFQSIGLAKGDRIAVVGEIWPDEFVGNDSVKHYVTEFFVQDVAVLSTKPAATVTQEHYSTTVPVSAAGITLGPRRDSSSVIVPEDNYITTNAKRLTTKQSRARENVVLEDF